MKVIENIKTKQHKHTAKVTDLMNSYMIAKKVRPQDFVEISYDLGICILAQALGAYEDEDEQIDALNNLAMDVQECIEFMKDKPKRELDFME